MRRSSGEKWQRGLATLAVGFGLFGLLLFSLLLPVAHATPCPVIGSPKDFTVLLADRYDSTPLGDRTPLILIHGILGNKIGKNDSVNNPNWDYWFNFSRFFYYWGASSYPILKDKFKLYYFFYESNKICVNDIAKGLRDWIDERTNQQQGTANKLEDVPFVIVTHSMGGLVSRAFMNNTVFNVGALAGQLGGNRVIKLITLGTPHHGSISSNGVSAVSAQCLWSETKDWFWPHIAFASHLYWDTNDDYLVDVEVSDPNRNDLLWDNYNGSIDDCLSYTWNLEDNQLLGSLNYQTGFDSKTIAYGGTLALDDLTRPKTLQEFLVDCPAIALAVGDLYSRDLYLCTSFAMYEALKNPSDYGLNDGAVPIRSALFEGHNLAGSHELPGFDHGQIRGVNLYPSDSKYYRSVR